MSLHFSPRVPLEPLMVATGCDRSVSQFVRNVKRGNGRYERLDGTPYDEQSNPRAAMAELAGRSLRTVHRWVVDGIPIEAAEDTAFKAGLHPFSVWGDDWLFAAGCPLASVVAGLA